MSDDHSENAADRLAHGTHSRGERHVNAKLTAEDVKAIRSLKGKPPRSELAGKYGVHPDTVNSIQRGAYCRYERRAFRGIAPNRLESGSA